MYFLISTVFNRAFNTLKRNLQTSDKLAEVNNRP